MAPIIFVIILCASSACLIAYGIATPKLWKEEITIEEPKIYDLDKCADQSVINRYTKEEILSYQNYRRLESEIKKFQGGDMSSILTVLSPIIYCITIAEVMKSCGIDLSSFWTYAISFAIALVLLAIPLIAISKLFPSSDFNITRKELFEEYASHKTSPQYPISEDRDFNNFVRSRHHLFLYAIRNREQIRYTLRIVGFVLMFVAIITSLTF